MYSPEEIQTAVERLVRSSIRRETDTLGVRRSDLAFNDVQEAAAGVFLLYPNAPFYVVALGCQRLLDSVTGFEATQVKLLAAITATGRKVLPIDDVSSLFNAKAALEELESATTGRTQGFKDISKLPAYQRFSANIGSFLEGPAANVRSAGDVVATPEQARRQIPPLLTELTASLSELVIAARYLAGALEDYAAMNLPALVARGVISRSRVVIGEHAAMLDGLSREDRLIKVRDVTLDVIASKAVVRTFGSFSGPTAFYPLSGVGVPYADATHPALPPRIEQQTSAQSFTILEGANVLSFLFEGGAALDVALPPSYVAELNGSVAESAGASGEHGFLIGDGAVPAPPVGSVVPNNSELQLQVGTTTYVIPLTRSATYASLRTVEQICADINAVLPMNVRAEPYFAPLSYDGLFDIAAGSPTAVFSVPGGASDLLALGIQTDDVVQVESGPNAGVFVITSVAATSLVVMRAAGAFVVETQARAQVGPALRRLRISCTDPAAQVPGKVRLASVQTTARSQSGAATLGFARGLASECRTTSIDEVVAHLNASTTQVVTSSIFISTVAGTASHTNLLTPFEITLAAYTGVGDAVFIGTLLVLRGSFADAEAAPGHILVLRSGPNAGMYGVILVKMSTSIQVACSSVGVDVPRSTFDAGPVFASNEFDTLRIEEGPNRGDFLVDGPGSTPLDVALKTAPGLVVLGAAPIVAPALLGKKRLVLESKSTTTSGELTLGGPAAALFGGGHAFGTTPYLQLPSVPAGLQAGDTLETHATDYQVPSGGYAITAIETSRRIITVAPLLASNVSWAFDARPPPFARLRHGKTAEYGLLHDRLVAWLARPELQSAFLRDLTAYVNPLLVNMNPTAFQLQRATTQLSSVRGVVVVTGALTPSITLAYALGQYKVDPVAPVDTLLRTYKEKGSDRATDLLLSGRFSTFFGLTVDEASYAGTVQSVMREVAREDVSLRKTSRSGSLAERQLSSADSPDADYDRNDIEGGAQVDPPGNAFEPGG